MLLSSAMILEVLSDYDPVSDLKGYDTGLTLARFRFYDEETSLYPDTLYVFPEDAADTIRLNFLSIVPGTALLFLGPIEKEGIPAEAAWISTNKKLSPERAVNLLWNVFERYRRIENALQDAIRSHQPLQTLVETATPLFGNEITSEVYLKIIIRKQMELY